MARKKRKKRHEEHVDESWLVPYADIMTLLLALFIVLFSASSVDAIKFQQLSGVFNEIFKSGSGVMEYKSPVNDPNKITIPEDTHTEDETEEKKQDPSFGDKEQEELSEIQEKVNQYINENDLDKKLETLLTDEGLLVTIRDNVFFESGSADMKMENDAIAREMSNLLVMSPPRNIIISGHTDNVPIQTQRYESNWELSVMRAVNFMQVLLENERLNPEWFSAKGYGEFKSIASNDSKEGRAKNRRVEILIVPRTSVN